MPPTTPQTMFLALMSPTAREVPPLGDLAREAAALRPAVRAVISSMLREPPTTPDVDDATNETLRRALEHTERMQDAQNARAYVLGIARHVALDVIRSRKKARTHDSIAEELGSQRTGVELVEGGPDPYELVEGARRAELIRRAFDSLPEGQRKALKMFHLEGLEYQEIAERLSVPLGTIATWVSRGRKAMATTLADTRES